MSAETVDVVPTTQQRKKPIRTYGRRSAAAAVKADSKPSMPRQLSPEETPAPQLPPPSSSETVPPSIECPKPNAPKSSILSYFKAKPKTIAESKETTSKAATPVPTSTEELVSTPPSPPPSSTGQRKRRRLTTRPTFDDEYDGENKDSKRRKEENGGVTPVAQDGETPTDTPSASQTETDSTGTNQVTAKKKRAAKTPTKEMVQTTLSLTIGDPKPQFIVCKECSMLYNHLNDKDRRDHKRVHAAYIRGRSRSRNKEDNDDT